MWQRPGELLVQPPEENCTTWGDESSKKQQQNTHKNTNVAANNVENVTTGQGFQQPPSIDAPSLISQEMTKMLENMMKTFRTNMTQMVQSMLNGHQN